MGFLPSRQSPPGEEGLGSFISVSIRDFNGKKQPKAVSLELSVSAHSWATCVICCTGSISANHTSLSPPKLPL